MNDPPIGLTNSEHFFHIDIENQVLCLFKKYGLKLAYNLVNYGLW